MMPRPRTLLFVDGLWVEKFGIMSLIPHLEKEGWKVHLLLTRNTGRMVREIRRLKPEWLAFSVTTGYHHKALQMAGDAKQAFPRLKTIFGGPHVTYFPEIANHPAVDAAVRGECDREFPDIIDGLRNDSPLETLPNLVRPGSPPTCNPLANLESDLDSLPLPDRDHYYRYPLFSNSPYKAFMVSRGCPYDCAFCFNHKLRTMYRGKGRFLRLRSPESVVEEGLRVKRRWGMKLASFEDDLLTYDIDWLTRFVTAGKARVDVPYNLNATARDLTDPSLVRLLKETGAWCVAFGIETGDEKLRRKVLHKPLTDDDIRRAAGLLNENKLLFHTYNMFGLPGEGVPEALKTIRLNREIGTTLARYTLFQPYPGTTLGDLVAGPSGTSEMLFSNSPRQGVEARRIEKLQKFAMLGFRSRAGEHLGLIASHLPYTPLHTAVFWATYFNVVRRYMKTGYRHLLELGFRSMTDVL